MAEYFVVLCPQCTTVAYRSRKPIEADAKLAAADFVATDPAFPAPTDGKPLLCPACDSIMKVASESVASKFTDSVDIEKAQYASSADKIKSTATASETLFAVRQGETVKNIVERKDCIIVITDKRIERIIL